MYRQPNPAFDMRIRVRSSDVCSSDLANKILHGAIAKVMTRPTIGSLMPSGSVGQFNFRIISGNPFLDPYRATTYDLAAEWYFAPGAIASVALFATDIVSLDRKSVV